MRLLLILLLISCYSFGQNPEIKRTWHWYFGQGAGIDFSTGSAVADTSSSIDCFEGVSCLSDMNGDLLFYTDGDTVWNKQHQPMPNGYDLTNWTDTNFRVNSSTQGALIIPKPGNPNLFYIITNDCDEDQLAEGLRYSIVDITLQGGMGDVTLKNKLIYYPVAEKLTAVYHATQNALWLITHDASTGSDAFLSFKITSTGIDTIPVVSNVGVANQGFGQNSRGYLKASPAGDKIATALYGLEVVQLFDLDCSTGIISNPIDFPSHQQGTHRPYGVEFSPNSNVLYLSEGRDHIYQYDLNAGTANDIVNSAFHIQADKISILALQLASDGKIYTAGGLIDTMGVINDPNVLGAGCNYVNSQFYLNGRQVFTGLPNFTASYFGSEPLGAQAPSAHYAKIAIHPNPTEGKFEVSSLEFGVEKVEVYDLFGRPVPFNFDVQRSVLDIRSSPAGIYFVKIGDEVRKLVLNKKP